MVSSLSQEREIADFDGWLVNPEGKTHGAPSDDERHVGDLGNFKTDGQGNAKGSVSDKLIKLIGEQSVLGVRDPSYFPISISAFSGKTSPRRTRADAIYSEPLSCTREQMTSERVTTQRARRQAMREQDLPVALLESQPKWQVNPT